MCWIVDFHPKFVEEFSEFSEAVQDALLAEVNLLEKYGPMMGRPHVDTLNGSKHPNMKELRFVCDNGVWRVAFAFDPQRQGILLVAGDKSGVSEKRFYKQLIKKADGRFDEHLTQLEEENQ
ncbi:MAG: type II toxin-antitoxin system RelE/ParE family toxin [Calothrix sp. MO_167.B42]|nr:type II toxin-antitoxin system RelE/ParE family toxin [Calothrix sp. MO_167.B42]